jgi:DNA-binding transcriptional regulator YdaS (Cro superfamily)
VTISRFQTATSSAIGRALDHFGNHNAMARAVGMTRKALWQARMRGRLSINVAERIHRITGGLVRKEELRPDAFPRNYAEAKGGALNPLAETVRSKIVGRADGPGPSPAGPDYKKWVAPAVAGCRML